MKTLNQVKKDIISETQYLSDACSDKQAWYLAKLLTERGADADSLFNCADRPTSKSVSLTIDLMLKNPELFAKNENCLQ